MGSAIDSAGRIVVPKKMRERYNLLPGTELEFVAESEGLLIRPVGNVSALVHKRGVLVHHGYERTNLDIAEFVRSQREARSVHSVDIEGE